MAVPNNAARVLGVDTPDSPKDTSLMRHMALHCKELSNSRCFRKFIVMSFLYYLTLETQKPIPNHSLPIS